MFAMRDSIFITITILSSTLKFQCRLLFCMSNLVSWFLVFIHFTLFSPRIKSYAGGQLTLLHFVWYAYPT